MNTLLVKQPGVTTWDIARTMKNADDLTFLVKLRARIVSLWREYNIIALPGLPEAIVESETGRKVMDQIIALSALRMRLDHRAESSSSSSSFSSRSSLSSSRYPDSSSLSIPHSPPSSSSLSFLPPQHSIPSSAFAQHPAPFLVDGQASQLHSISYVSYNMPPSNNPYTASLPFSPLDRLSVSASFASAPSAALVRPLQPVRVPVSQKKQSERLTAKTWYIKWNGTCHARYPRRGRCRRYVIIHCRDCQILIHMVQLSSLWILGMTMTKITRQAKAIGFPFAISDSMTLEECKYGN